MLYFYHFCVLGGTADGSCANGYGVCCISKMFCCDLIFYIILDFIFKNIIENDLN